MTKYNYLINTIFKSGEILMEGLNDKREFTFKEKQHYLTKYDIEIDALLVKIIKETYQNDTIISEEGGISKGNNEYTWYIDPISNTRNYIHGLPGFAIAVGLMKENKPIVGFVYDPWLKELFSAELGKGAFLNGKKIQCSHFAFGDDAFINVDWQKRKGIKKIKEGIKIFSETSKHCTVRAIGSVALMACYVGCGRLDAMLNNYSDFHALVPASVIVKESGGSILDLDGKSWNLESKSTFVTNNVVTTGILSCLKK